ncbi:hypothetical protein [Flavobacterium sp. XS2P39]|uniref:hypothetical protein n=1 Tax=Flavobacterium sp. XS2P39 TaxID=3401725 RepID=UPI003AAF6F47
MKLKTIGKYLHGIPIKIEKTNTKTYSSIRLSFFYSKSIGHLKLLNNTITNSFSTVVP